MKNLKWITPLFFALVFNVKAQEALDKYLRQAAENNLALKAKFNEYLAYLKKIPQVDALPDPQIAFGYFVSPVETRVGAQQFKLSLAQKFPWFGKLSARGDTKTNLAKIKLKEFQALKDNLYYNVKKAWYNIYLVRKNIALVKKQIKFYKTLESLSEIKFENGSKGLSDVIRTKIKLDDYENKLKNLKLELNPLKAEFNKLLNRDALAEIEASDSLPLDKFDFEANGLDSIFKSNAKLKTLKQLKRTAESDKKLAKLEGYPDLGLSLNYTSVLERTGLDIPQNGQDIFIPTLTFNLPIYRNKYNAKVQEYEIRSKMFDQKIDDYKNQIESDYRKAVADYQNARRNIEFLQRQIDRSKDVLNLLTTDYSSSGKGFIDIILTKEKILEYEFRLDKEKVKLNMAVALLKLLNSKF